AAIRDAARERLPERGDLVVGRALAEVSAGTLRQIADQVEEARDRVAVGVVVAGEEVERAVAPDGLGRARGDAEVALEARIPLDGTVVCRPLEIGHHRINQAVSAEPAVEE